MNLKRLLSFCLVALLSLDTIHADEELCTEEEELDSFSEKSSQIIQFAWDNQYNGSHDGSEKIIVSFPDEKPDNEVILTRSERPMSYEDPPNDCTYSGYLGDESSVLVTVNGCPNSKNFTVVTGNVDHPDEIFVVREGVTTPLDASTTNQVLDNLRNESLGTDVARTGLYDLPAKFYGSVLVIYDQSLIDLLGDTDAVARELNDILILTSALFQDKSLKTSFQFDTVGMDFIDSTIPITRQGLDYVKTLSDRNRVDANIYMYVTKYPGYGPKGLASTVGYTCSRHNRDRSAIMGYIPDGNMAKELTAQNFAHEIGHLLEIYSDYTSRGAKRRCATTPNTVMGNDAIRNNWSTCSLRDFLNYFYGQKKHHGSFCMTHEGSISLCIDRLGYQLCGSSKKNGKCDMIDHYNGCRKTCEKCYM